MNDQTIKPKAHIGRLLRTLPYVAEGFVPRTAQAKEGVPETLEVSEPEVLKEIRDALVSLRGGPMRGGHGEDPGRGHDR